MLTPMELPALTPDEAAQTERVAARIRREVDAAGGWIPFRQFMQLALYAPGLGYYSAGARKFGAAGDFITAPELTPVFARCLATQLAETLAATGGGNVLEAGAGTGALAADLLAALAERDALPERYWILEISADLRDRQRRLLVDRVPTLAERVAWLDAPPASPWRGVAIANEVLDALPVERFQVDQHGYRQVGVEWWQERFAFAARPAGEWLARQLDDRLGSLPERPATGFEGEFSPLIRPWIAEFARGLERGALLFVDYGLPRAPYYHPSRAAGSLTGFFRHRRVEDVLARPGLQDITAWVDFTEVAEGGAAAGLDVAGFATQAHFLIATGLERELAAASEHLDVAARARLAQAVATLVMPGEMGERFKAIALARGLEAPLAGFAFRDLAATL